MLSCTFVFCSYVPHLLTVSQNYSIEFKDRNMNAPCTRTRRIEKIMHKYVFPTDPSS